VGVTVVLTLITLGVLLLMYAFIIRADNDMQKRKKVRLPGQSRCGMCLSVCPHILLGLRDD